MRFDEIFIFAGITYLVDSWHQFAIALKIHVIASVNGVFVGLFAKLQSEQSVFAPGNIFLHVNFVLGKEKFVKSQCYFFSKKIFLFRMKFTWKKMFPGAKTLCSLWSFERKLTNTPFTLAITCTFNATENWYQLSTR